MTIRSTCPKIDVFFGVKVTNETFLHEVQEILSWYATDNNADVMLDPSGEALYNAILDGSAPSFASEYISLFATGYHPNAIFLFRYYETKMKSGRVNVTLDIDAFDYSSVIFAVGSSSYGYNDKRMTVPKILSVKTLTKMGYACTNLTTVKCNDFDEQTRSSIDSYELGP